MLRRIIIALSFSFLVAGVAWTQTDPFMPPNPITMGMGGAYTANAEGYNAFFYNPAGFARESEFTLLSTNVYGVLDKKLYDLATQMVTAAANGKDPMSALLPISRGLAARAVTDGLPDIPGLDLPPEAIETLMTTATDVGDYLSDVAATENGAAAITAGLEALVDDPIVAAALADAGVDPSDTAAMAALAADPNAVTDMMQYILVADSATIGKLYKTFVDAVAAEAPSVPVPPAVANAGEALKAAVDQFDKSLMEFLPSGNANVGAMVGFGYVGNGLGLGLFANVNAGLYTPTGSSIRSSTARASTFLTFAGGYALTLAEKLRIGVQVRPTVLGYVSFLPAPILMDLLTSAPVDTNAMIAAIMSNGVYKGFRIGVDVGALWDIGDFTLGLAVKDIIPNTEVYMKYTDTNALLYDFPNFKGAKADDTAYHVPAFKLNIGVQWHPDLGVISDIVDPRIGLDFMDFLGWIRQLPGTTAEEKLAAVRAKTAMMTDYDFLQMINLGAQVKFFKFITLSAGIGQGMATAGLGLNLLLLDINASVGARYKFDSTGALVSKTIDDFSEVAFSLEVAVLRF